jgi:hypothetical protein
MNGGFEGHAVLDADLYPFALFKLKQRAWKLPVDVNHFSLKSIRRALSPCKFEFIVVGGRNGKSHKAEQHG